MHGDHWIPCKAHCGKPQLAKKNKSFKSRANPNKVFQVLHSCCTLKLRERRSQVGTLQMESWQTFCFQKIGTDKSSIPPSHLSGCPPNMPTGADSGFQPCTNWLKPSLNPRKSNACTTITALYIIFINWNLQIMAPSHPSLSIAIAGSRAVVPQALQSAVHQSTGPAQGSPFFGLRQQRETGCSTFYTKKSRIAKWFNDDFMLAQAA